MADIKLESDYWETSGIRDRTQNKTQRQINADFDAALDSEITARQNADSALQGSLNNITPFDTTPTSGSTKGVTSGGVNTALNSYETIPITLNNNAITRGYIQCWKFGKIAIIDCNIINDSQDIAVGTQLATGFPKPLNIMYPFLTAYNKVQNVVLYDSGSMAVVDNILPAGTWWKTNTVYICQ